MKDKSSSTQKTLKLGISGKGSYRETPSMSGCAKSGSKACGGGIKNG